MMEAGEVSWDELRKVGTFEAPVLVRALLV